jgi:tRNA 2-thiocytidine biosynthesis protein TtcA
MNERIGPRELQARAGDFKVFDIRKEPDERKIPGSVTFEGGALESGADVPFDKSEPVVLYCGSGNSCNRIAKTLRDRGYNALALDGGYRGWVAEGLPTAERH